MPWVEVALPGTLLLLKFLLKLFVDRSATAADIVSAILALPVDVVFLAAALLAGIIIANPHFVREGIILFGVAVAIGVLAVVLWRRADSLFVQNRYLPTVLVGGINHLISFYILVIALERITPPAVTK